MLNRSMDNSGISFITYLFGGLTIKTFYTIHIKGGLEIFANTENLDSI